MPVGQVHALHAGGPCSLLALHGPLSTDQEQPTHHQGSLQIKKSKESNLCLSNSTARRAFAFHKAGLGSISSIPQGTLGPARRDP